MNVNINGCGPKRKMKKKKKKKKKKKLKKAVNDHIEAKWHDDLKEKTLIEIHKSKLIEIMTPRLA